MSISEWFLIRSYRGYPRDIIRIESGMVEPTITRGIDGLTLGIKTPASWDTVLPTVVEAL